MIRVERMAQSNAAAIPSEQAMRALQETTFATLHHGCHLFGPRVKLPIAPLLAE